MAVRTYQLRRQKLNTSTEWTDQKVLQVVETVEYESLERLNSSLWKFSAILAIFNFTMLWYCDIYYKNFKSEVIIDAYGWTNQVSSPSNLPRVILLMMSTTLLVTMVIGIIVSRMQKYTIYELEDLADLAEESNALQTETDIVPPTHKPIY